MGIRVAASLLLRVKSLTVAIFFSFVLWSCSPYIYSPAPPYPHRSNFNKSSNLGNRVNIFLLPVSDSRNVPPKFIGQQPGPLYYYFTEPVSEIVRKAAQIELDNFGYKVSLCDEIMNISFYPGKSVYLKVNIQEFSANQFAGTFHSKFPFSIALNCILMNEKGYPFAKNTFSENGKKVTVFLETTNVKNVSFYMVTDVLPKVLQDMTTWVNTNVMERPTPESQKTGEGQALKRLETLKELREKKLITEEEYNRTKIEILKSF
jgi:hypothetical protein